MKKRSAEPKWLGYLDNRVLDAVLPTLAVGMFAVGNITGWFLLNVFGVFIFALLLLNASCTATIDLESVSRQIASVRARSRHVRGLRVRGVVVNALALVGGGKDDRQFGYPRLIAGCLICYGIAWAMRRFGPQIKPFAAYSRALGTSAARTRSRRS